MKRLSADDIKNLPSVPEEEFEKMKEFAKEVQLQRESLSYKQMKIDDDTVSEDIEQEALLQQQVPLKKPTVIDLNYKMKK